jgi:hypothetical protein
MSPKFGLLGLICSISMPDLDADWRECGQKGKGKKLSRGGRRGCAKGAEEGKGFVGWEPRNGWFVAAPGCIERSPLPNRRPMPHDRNGNKGDVA